ncbi:Uncharacterised protein [Mycobacteroides abscessus subsp. abscessus]|nr:Uncharacterised protein [Mycobacteroides abscessus subsp. abscessus]
MARGFGMPAMVSYRSRCRCGSSTPAAAMRTPPTSISRRVWVMSCQPRSVNAARRSCHGSGSPCLRSWLLYRYLAGFLRRGPK